MKKYVCNFTFPKEASHHVSHVKNFFVANFYATGRPKLQHISYKSGRGRLWYNLKAYLHKKSSLKID